MHLPLNFTDFTYKVKISRMDIDKYFWSAFMYISENKKDIMINKGHICGYNLNGSSLFQTPEEAVKDFDLFAETVGVKGKTIIIPFKKEDLTIQ